jgi:hypothetical protein
MNARPGHEAASDAPEDNDSAASAVPPGSGTADAGHREPDGDDRDGAMSDEDYTKYEPL